MLSNKVALVTGAGRGLGQAIASILAREGAKVAISDLDLHSCQKVGQTLANSHQHLPLSLDVSQKASVLQAVEKIQETFGQPPDVVVNSAGITMDKYLLRY